MYITAVPRQLATPLVNAATPMEVSHASIGGAVLEAALDVVEPDVVMSECLSAGEVGAACFRRFTTLPRHG